MQNLNHEGTVLHPSSTLPGQPWAANWGVQRSNPITVLLLCAQVEVSASSQEI